MLEVNWQLAEDKNSPDQYIMSFKHDKINSVTSIK